MDKGAAAARHGHSFAKKAATQVEAGARECPFSLPSPGSGTATGQCQLGGPLLSLASTSLPFFWGRNSPGPAVIGMAAFPCPAYRPLGCKTNVKWQENLWYFQRKCLACFLWVPKQPACISVLLWARRGMGQCYKPPWHFPGGGQGSLNTFNF